MCYPMTKWPNINCYKISKEINKLYKEYFQNFKKNLQISLIIPIFFEFTAKILICFTNAVMIDVL
jgi:hypothetical protein